MRPLLLAEEMLLLLKLLMRIPLDQFTRIVRGEPKRNEYGPIHEQFLADVEKQGPLPSPLPNRLRRSEFREHVRRVLHGIRDGIKVQGITTVEQQERFAHLVRIVDIGSGKHAEEDEVEDEGADSADVFSEWFATWELETEERPRETPTPPSTTDRNTPSDRPLLETTTTTSSSSRSSSRSSINSSSIRTPRSPLADENAMRSPPIWPRGPSMDEDQSPLAELPVFNRFPKGLPNVFTGSRPATPMPKKPSFCFAWEENDKEAVGNFEETD